MFLLKNQSIQLKSMALLQTVDGSLSELAIPITQHPPPPRAPALPEFRAHTFQSMPEFRGTTNKRTIFAFHSSKVITLGAHRYVHALVHTWPAQLIDFAELTMPELEHQERRCPNSGHTPPSRCPNFGPGQMPEFRAPQKKR